MKRELLEVLRSVRSLIELEMATGVKEYLAGLDDGSPASAAAGPSGKDLLESLEVEALSCKNCPLSKGRNNVVFGAGNRQARLMFIGEGPGYDEDLQGLPFVGRAGKLLTKIIEAMGLKRKDVYITNVVKCRPPQNRNPLPTEILSCEGYLTRQIEIIKPKVICTLGNVPTKALLRTEKPISSLRGRFCDFRGTMLMPTFHPAYLLRNPDGKKLVWQDMKKIMAELS